MSSKKLNIVQIVRNWGPVGGMESYVWHLSHELVKLECTVTIICEKVHQSANDSNIQVIEIGRIKQKPRWLLYWRFAKQVERILESIKINHPLVIHSHERSISHDITTFHSMPFATIKNKGWWRLISIRAWAYLKMEARELGQSPNRKLRIIPVSSVIAQAIEQYYPSAKSNIQQPITPAVPPMPPRAHKEVSVNGGIVGFIGKEWKRKGLLFFIKMMAQLKLSRPHLKLVILGPEEKEIKSICNKFNGEIIFKGWQSSANIYQTLDLLVHPASSEAYGMIIAEAMSCQVPVIVSDACGAASDVAKENGSVLSLDADLSTWVQKCDEWLKNTNHIPKYDRPWSQVAIEYLDQYQKIAHEKAIS